MAIGAFGLHPGFLSATTGFLLQSVLFQFVCFSKIDYLSCFNGVWSEGKTSYPFRPLGTR